MTPRIALLTLASLLFCGSLCAQSPDLSVEMRNFKLIPDQTDAKGRRGIAMEFDLRFSKVITDFDDSRFTLTWKLVDQTGKTILRSEQQKEYEDQKEVLTARKPWNSKVSYMEKTELSIAIPFSLIKLPAGPQSLQVVFSLENKAYQFPDFESKAINFEQRKFVKHGLSEQQFTVSNLKFGYNVKGFGVDDPGMNIRLHLKPKYGNDESRDGAYHIYVLLRDNNGKVLFDSRECASVHHRHEGLYLDHLEEDGTDHMQLFLNYAEINMRGPAEVEVVLLAEANDKVKEIYSQKHYLEVPLKYRFDEQEFKLEGLSAEMRSKDEVQGILITFAVNLSKIGPRLDPEKGNYFIYPVFRDQGGNVLWQPEALEEKTHGSSRLSNMCEAFEGDNPVRGSLFIPWYVLQLPRGMTTVQYSIFASDKYRNVKFPELGKGGLVVKAPPLRKYKMRLTDLVMKNSDYDTQLDLLSSNLPDLQWTFRIGEDRVYESSKRKNSLRAPSGEARIVIAEGDSCAIVLYDIDSGFFNASDLLGHWPIPYLKKGQKFVLERKDEGLLEHLRVEVEMEMVN